MAHHLYVASAFGVAGFCFMLLVAITLFQQRILNRRLARFYHHRKTTDINEAKESL